MDFMSLAAITRVDTTLTKGETERRNDALFFHSEGARLRWLLKAEAYLGEERRGLSRTASPVAGEPRHLLEAEADVREWVAPLDD